MKKPLVLLSLLCVVCLALAGAYQTGLIRISQIAGVTNGRLAYDNGSTGAWFAANSTGTKKFLSQTSSTFNWGTLSVSDVAGAGTVTSVALTAPAIFSVSGSPVTGAGTLAIGLNGAATGSLPYASSSSVMAWLGIGTSGQFLQTVSGNPGWSTMSGDASLASGGAITLATVNGSPGTFGGTTHSLSATVNGKGLITALSATDISAKLLPTGTNTHTLRNSSGTWVDTGFMTNDGSQVVVNPSPSTASVVPFIVQVAATGSIPDGFEVQDPNSADPTGLALVNSGSSTTMRMALVGTAGQFFAAVTGAQDGVLYLGADKRFWFGTNALPKMVLDSTGLVIGSTAAAGAKLDVTAAASAKAAKFTGASGQVAVDIIGTPGSAIPSLQVQADSNAVANFITTGGQAQIYAQTSVSPVTSTNLMGLYARGLQSATSTVLNGAALVGQAKETWDATHAGGAWLFQTTPNGSTTLASRMLIDQNGDINFNQSGSALSTSATGGFPYPPTMAGAPSGTPTARTGAAPIVINTSDFNGRMMMYVSGVWVPVVDPSIARNSTKSGNYTLVLADDTVYFDNSAGVAMTCTVPAASGVPTGKRWTIKNLPGSAASVSVARSSTDKFNSGAGAAGTTSITIAAGGRITIEKQAAGNYESID